MVLFSASPETTQIENMIGAIFVGIFFLEIIMSNKKIELPWNRSITILIIYLTLSLALLLLFQGSFRRFITFFLTLLLFFIVYCTAREGRTLIIATIGMGLGLMLLIYVNIQDIILLSQGMQSERFNAGFNPNEFAYILLFFIWLLINISHDNGKKKPIYNIVLVLLILLCSYLIIFTGSRKGIILLSIFMISAIFIIISNYSIFKKIIIILPTIIFSILLINWFQETPFYYRIENIINLIGGGNVQDGSIEDRVGMFETGIRLWSQKPLLGWGFDSFRYVSGYGTYSHNNYIEILVNTGIIGFIIYHIFYINVIINCIKKYIINNIEDRKKQLMLSLIGMLLLLLWSFGAVSYTSKVTWLWTGFILGVIDSNSFIEKRKYNISKIIKI